MRIPRKVVGVRVSSTPMASLPCSANRVEPFGDNSEGLVHSTSSKTGAPSSSTTRRTTGLQDDPVFVKLLQRRTLRADESLREHIVLVAPDALHGAITNLDLQTAGGLTQRAGSNNSAVSRNEIGHAAMLAGVRRMHPTTYGARMELVPLCTLEASLGDMHMVGAGPAGARTVAEVSGGTVTGERLAGTVKGNAAADWMLTSSAGIATLDVRVVVETNDGALIYITYEGRADWSEGPGTSRSIWPRSSRPATSATPGSTPSGGRQGPARRRHRELRDRRGPLTGNPAPLA